MTTGHGREGLLNGDTMRGRRCWDGQRTELERDAMVVGSLARSLSIALFEGKHAHSTEMEAPVCCRLWPCCDNMSEGSQIAPCRRNRGESW
jgi:hypothetical protein